MKITPNMYYAVNSLQLAYTAGNFQTQPTISYNGGGVINITPTMNGGNTIVTAFTITNGGYTNCFTSPPTIVLSGTGYATCTCTLTNGVITAIALPVVSGNNLFTAAPTISVYGGDELDPPKYGCVAISVDLLGDNYLSTSKKNEYMKYITDKTPLTITPIFIDPEYLYAKLTIDAHYSLKYSSKSEQELESLIRTAISTYNNANLNDFGSVLRVSRLSSEIDAVDAAILSNNIDAKPIIDYSPLLNTASNPIFKFQSSIVKPYAFTRTTGFADYKPSLTSSVFSYVGNSSVGVCSILQDDGQGNIHVVSSDINSREVLNASAGTIDYTTGVVRLINFKVASYSGSAIKIYADTTDNDITSPKNRVFNIRDSDVIVNMIEIK
jgi:hypothetical protein